MLPGGGGLNINLGCGEKKLNGEAGEQCINVDFRKTAIADVVHDLTVFPWPFPSEEFDAAYAIDIIEHMVHVIPFVDETWRILKPGGKLYIRTTYFETEQSYSDPTHHHFFTLSSFDFFDPTTPIGMKYHWYTERKWLVVNKALHGEETIFEMEKVI